MTSARRARSVDGGKLASMATCPICAHLAAEGQRYCPSCGTALDVDGLPTGTAPRPSCARGPACPQSRRIRPRRARDRGRPPRRGRRAPGSPAGLRAATRSLPDHAASPLRARRAARGPLPHRRPARPRRHGRGLPRRRPAARPAGRAEFLPEARRPTIRRGSTRFHNEVRIARQVVASQRLPRLRHRRGGGAALPLHGVRGRRGPRVAAAPHRPPARRTRPRDRAPALRRARGRARPGRPAPRPQARERHARRPRQGAHHRLRPGRLAASIRARRPLAARPPTWRRAARGRRGHDRAATSTRSASCSTSSSPGRSAFDGPHPRRAHRDSASEGIARTPRRSCATSIPRSSA